MESTGHSERQPIFMLSTEGKSNEQLAHEAWEAIQAYREAKARQEPFQPVLDLKPEPEVSTSQEAAGEVDNENDCSDRTYRADTQHRDSSRGPKRQRSDLPGNADGYES